MTSDIIEFKLVDIFQNALSGRDISIYDDFESDMNMDLIGMARIKIEIEQEFNISIPDEEIVQISTILELIRYMEKRLN